MLLFFIVINIFVCSLLGDYGWSSFGLEFEDVYEVIMLMSVLMFFEICVCSMFELVFKVVLIFLVMVFYGVFVVSFVSSLFSRFIVLVIVGGMLGSIWSNMS